MQFPSFLLELSTYKPGQPFQAPTIPQMHNHIKMRKNHPKELSPNESIWSCLVEFSWFCDDKDEIWSKVEKVDKGVYHPR